MPVFDILETLRILLDNSYINIDSLLFVEKSVVLIDAENVLKSWITYCKSNNLDEKLDYVKLRDILSNDTNLLRAYFYSAVPEELLTKKKNFLAALQKSGIQLRIKFLKVRHESCLKCGHIQERLVQKGVDVSLATDILRHAWQKTCDVCIVVSGDEDYKDAIDVAKDKGIKIWIAAFRFSLSRELEHTADKVIFLEEIFTQIKRKV